MTLPNISFNQFLTFLLGGYEKLTTFAAAFKEIIP